MEKSTDLMVGRTPVGAAKHCRGRNVCKAVEAEGMGPGGNSSGSAHYAVVGLLPATGDRYLSKPIFSVYGAVQ